MEDNNNNCNEEEVLECIKQLEVEVGDSSSSGDSLWEKYARLGKLHFQLWKRKNEQSNSTSTKKEKAKLLQETKENLIFSTIHYQQAIELCASHQDIVDLHLTIANVYTKLAKKYKIPPMFRVGIEHLQKVVVMNTECIATMKCIMMTKTKIAKMNLRFTIMKMKLEKEVDLPPLHESFQLYLSLHSQYKSIYQQINSSSPINTENNNNDNNEERQNNNNSEEIKPKSQQQLIPPLFKTTLKKYNIYRCSSQPNLSQQITQPINNNNNTDVNNNNNSNIEGECGIEGRERSPSIIIKDQLSGNEIVGGDITITFIRDQCFKLLYGWGKLQIKQAKLVENWGDLRLSLRLYFSAYLIFFKSLKLNPKSNIAFQYWTRSVDAMGELLCEDPSVDLFLIVRHYMDNFLILFENYQTLPLKPLIALSLSTDPRIKSASPLNSLKILAQHPSEEIARDAQQNIEFIQNIITQPINHQSDDGDFEAMFTIEDYELGFAHMPPSAQKIFAKSGLSYEEVRDYKFLIVNILLFLTSHREWPSHLLVFKKYRSFSSHFFLNVVDFKAQDPNNKLKHKVYLGRGAFSDVYHVRRKVNKGGKVKTETLAVKIFKKKYSESHRVINREILLLQMCKHKNIVNYIESYLWNDEVWTVMEYCSGGSLKQLLSMDALDEPKIAYFSREVLKGLQFLHNKKLVHRDIKATNILLHLNGRVTIGDLGLCAEVRSENEFLPMCGSRCWMAPEMIHRKQYGLPVDIWSFGCLLLEMANHSPPYYSYTPLQNMLYMATREPPRLMKPSKWSPEFCNFVNACLTLNPRLRPSTSDLLAHPFLLKSCSKAEIVPLLENAFITNSLIHSGLL